MDWNPKQTKLWRHYVKKNCPTANVVLVPDTKPIPWCWSSGKLSCFSEESLRNPGRFVYVDTDTIITKDLGQVFKEMPAYSISLSSAIPRGLSLTSWTNSKLGRHIANKLDIPEGEKLVHFSSGLVVLKDYPPGELGWRWRLIMEFPPFKKAFQNHRCCEEVALSYAVLTLKANVWHQPLEIHGNILRKPVFGKTTEPMVIHYHKERRLKANGLEKYLNVKD